ncbi:MAG: hypothetical protein QOJ50_3981 [Cryptosporangiaceae bacterium]|nr:hypothetical protein [Cryptosporangiaceae bacterium]
MPTTFAPRAAYPELAAARSALNAGDWPAVERFFGTLTEDLDHTAAVIALVAGVPPAAQFLREVCAGSGTTLARLMLAEGLIRRGWKARTTHRARNVSRKQFATFFDCVQQAEQLLSGVTAAEPWNTTAWTLRVVTARALELGQPESARRYAELARLSPHHAIAQRQRIQQLAPKWGGSVEAMHGFARHCRDTAPPGSASALAVADAHLEHWLHLGPGLTYMRGRAVRAELIDVAERSVLHPDYRPGLRWVQDHNTMAVALSLAGERSAAAHHFRILGRYGSLHPWDYLFDGSPRSAFAVHRVLALARGRHR